MGYHVNMSRIRRSVPLHLALLAATILGCGSRTNIHHDAGARDDDAGSGVTYGTVGFATGMVRFAVFKLDETDDRCVVVGFVWPIDRPTPGVELPDRWTVESAWRGEAAMCDGSESWLPEGVEHATAISGIGSWEEPMCEIDVDLTLVFEDGTEERMAVVEGVPLGWGGCEE